MGAKRTRPRHISVVLVTEDLMMVTYLHDPQHWYWNVRRHSDDQIISAGRVRGFRHFPCDSMIREHMMSFLQRPAGGSPGMAIAPCEGTREFLDNFPALGEYLTAEQWPDKSPRERSSLNLVVEDGMIKGCLNDKACSQSLWRSGESLQDLLLALEEALQSGRADWRRWRNLPAGGGSKKNR